MKRCALLLALLSVPALASPTQRVERPVFSKPLTIQLDGIPTGALVTMLLRDVMGVPYVISPDVLADRRPVSVRLVIPREQVPERVVGYLRRSGYTVTLDGGTVYVGRRGSFAAPNASRLAGAMLEQPASVPFGSPVAAGVVGHPDVAAAVPVVAPPPSSVPVSGAVDYPRSAVIASVDHSPRGILAFAPAQREPAYLASVIAAILPDLKFGARSEVSPDTDHQLVRSRDGPDLLVMTGSPEDLDKARSLCLALDRPRPLVAVKAVVMQVSDVRARGSALGVLASLGGGKFSVGSFSPDAGPGQFVRIASGAVQAVLSAVREDTRFKVVAAPNLTALSGEVATINSGAQVPTVGAAVAGDNGPPVQSIVYRDSGITLTVRPIVRGDLIELEVQQERSTFVRTATGVTDTPTLQKVSADAQVVLRSGESLALAGLTETSDTTTRKGIFGGLLGVRQRDQNNSELVVLITAALVPSPVAAAGKFTTIFDPLDAKDEAEDGSAIDPLAPMPRRATVALGATGER